jgi:transcriptional accessory protein Tex/SPT6
MNVPFNPGSPYGWAGMLGRKILNHTSVNRNAAVNEALLPRLLETNPAAVDSIITELEQRGEFMAAQRLRDQARMAKSALTGGAMIGAPVALPGE